MEAVCSSETLVYMYKSTRRYYPEDQHRYEVHIDCLWGNRLEGRKLRGYKINMDLKLRECDEGEWNWAMSLSSWVDDLAWTVLNLRVTLVDTSRNTVFAVYFVCVIKGLILSNQILWPNIQTCFIWFPLGECRAHLKQSTVTSFPAVPSSCVVTAAMKLAVWVSNYFVPVSTNVCR
jgi:hypothetical protein